MQRGGGPHCGKHTWGFADLDATLYELPEELFGKKQKKTATAATVGAPVGAEEMVKVTKIIGSHTIKLTMDSLTEAQLEIESFTVGLNGSLRQAPMANTHRTYTGTS